MKFASKPIQIPIVHTLVTLPKGVILLIMLQITDLHFFCSLYRAVIKIDSLEQFHKFYIFDGLPCPCVSDPVDESYF